MNMVEERIRAAARAAADTVAPDSVPPLELPAARPRRFGQWLRSARSPGAWWTPWAARLTPVAAALAVIAIVITVVTVSHPPHQGPDLVTGAAGRPDVPLGPPASTYVRSGQVPPYFVTLTPSGAAVHLTVGGATVATIQPSLPGGKVVAVTAAGDDRTFVLAEQGQDRKAVTFYQFRLGSSGRPGALTRLPMSVSCRSTCTSDTPRPSDPSGWTAVELRSARVTVECAAVERSDCATSAPKATVRPQLTIRRCAPSDISKARVEAQPPPVTVPVGGGAASRTTIVAPPAIRW